MFDIGFWEIIVIAIVALLVVGPDKFPGLIKETARWAARIRRFVIDTKREIEREIRLDDIEKGLSKDIKNLDNLTGQPPQTTPEQPVTPDQKSMDKQASA